MSFDFLIIGGGAAGFFAAINAAEKNPNLKIGIIERGKDVLQKVRVSGGGRCNVTHACFEPEELVKFYPRGEAELLKPFKRFNPTDTINWFEKRGVKIKKEADGRMFPVSDSSQTIIDCFLNAAYDLRIQIIKSTRVEKIQNLSIGGEQSGVNWQIQTNNQTFSAKKLMLATGSDTAIWKLLEELDLQIIPPVPSLFTFNIHDKKLNDLMGVSFKNVVVKANSLPNGEGRGGAIITHWGVSGPAVLKMSAWGARDLNLVDYKFGIKVNWLADLSKDEIQKQLHAQINQNPKKNVIANAEFGLPIRFWKYICEVAEVKEFQKWAETGKKHIQRIADLLTAATFKVEGKSTFKEEFVTAGGVDLSEIDFDTFSTKKYPTLYMAGEVLNIDAVTGGFNFQAAWTGGWHIAQAV
jgi:hypothetical protein